MRTKWILMLGALPLMLVAAYLAYRPQVELLVTLALQRSPDTPFTDTPVPAPPDYADPAAWAALPDRADQADVTPAGVTGIDQASAGVDVFYIHPTTFRSRTLWNQPLDDADTNSATDLGPIRGHASAFNGCCRVFAPRYRQGSLAAMTMGGADGMEAQALAVGDVKAAFAYFIEHRNEGRPFIIASHSQGTRVARELIPAMVDGTPLAQRLVAAYLIGNWIDSGWVDSLQTMHACTGPADTGCVVSWSTLAEDADVAEQKRAFAQRNNLPASYAEGRFLCTNPLAWRLGDESVPASANLGGWVYGQDESPRAPDVGVVGAGCRDGGLIVTAPTDDIYNRRLLPGGNYHVYDYSLFYMNIRANAIERAASMLRTARP